MTSRYYLPAETVEELETVLNDARGKNPKLVEDISTLIFGTAIPDDMAENLERWLKETSTSPSFP